MGHPHYTNQEISRRGKEWFEQSIRSQIDEERNRGKVLVIDVETGDYELHEDHLTAAHRALDKHPGATLYAMRIGYPSLAKVGGGWQRPQP